MPLILDGIKAANSLRAYIQKRHEQFTKDFGKKASIGVLQIGHDLASDVYIRRKGKAAQEVGMGFSAVRLPQEVSSDQVFEALSALLENNSGVILQLPLPGRHGQEKDRYLSAIDPNRDVDGLNLKHISPYSPCTPLGCLFLLDFYGIPLEGASCVIIGRSHLVGRPLAQLLLDRDATVTIAHRKTRNLPQMCAKADILFSAAGSCHLVQPDFVHAQTILVDVGIHRTDHGLTGDVDPKVYPLVSAYSPVPGGVGPMTVASLLWNTLQAAYAQEGFDLSLQEAISKMRRES